MKVYELVQKLTALSFELGEDFTDAEITDDAGCPILVVNYEPNEENPTKLDVWLSTDPFAI